MISLLSTHRDRSLPWMVMLSVVFHAVMITSLVIISSRWLLKPKPAEVTVTPVKLTEIASHMPLPVEIPKEIKTASAEPLPAPGVDDANPLSPASLRQQGNVTRKTLENRPTALLKPAKRKREPKRVEVAQEPPSRKDEQVPAPVKENEEHQIEEKLAAIREKLKQREDRPSQTGEEKSAPTFDRELAGWIEEVKRRINSHWTVMGLGRVSHEKATMIGLTLSESGQLKNAAIDKSSGDEVFDGSAMRAVYQAAPFPELSPRAVERITAEGGLTLMFTPTGIR